MTTPIPLLEGLEKYDWESSHGLGPSDPEKWGSVAMITPSFPLLEGRWSCYAPHHSLFYKEGREETMVLSDLEKMEEFGHGHPHTTSRVVMVSNTLMGMGMVCVCLMAFLL